MLPYLKFLHILSEELIHLSDVCWFILHLIIVTQLYSTDSSIGYEYTKAEILKKITFVMTDSTAHNIGVMNMVCEDLDLEDQGPKTLLCNIHPLMFQNKLKELYNEIQLSFGSKKLDDCFTVDVDFKNENFILKAINCLTIANEENSAKPWNRYSHLVRSLLQKRMKPYL